MLMEHDGDLQWYPQVEEDVSSPHHRGLVSSVVMALPGASSNPTLWAAFGDMSLATRFDGDQGSRRGVGMCIRDRRRTPAPAPGGDVPRSSPGRTSTAEPAAGHSSSGKDARPPRGLGDSTGLAVHQIITITVSLIMVIAALITTLVLKNW
ncbi:hypothetical protein AAES_161252 [Amazona aestiva]|uniref:AJAP1/PANP C-terminal domain-containing protein n=1 Tax=Amazona aestiva TaxID=12930 RepID=A0A0Q3P589_AMAAE|nr:hypothetical protein AAES_161252 [Amazona aestiva]